LAVEVAARAFHRLQDGLRMRQPPAAGLREHDAAEFAHLHEVVELPKIHPCILSAVGRSR
jgi:hypothetical protein